MSNAKVVNSSVDLFSNLMSWLQDKGIERSIQYKVNLLKPLVMRELRNAPKKGLLLYVEIYRGAEKQKLLHSVGYCGVGETPRQAYSSILEHGSISKTPPKHMLFDKQSSHLLWITL